MLILTLLAVQDSTWLLPCERVFGSAYTCLSTVSKNHEEGVLLGVVVGAGIECNMIVLKVRSSSQEEFWCFKI